MARTLLPFIIGADIEEIDRFRLDEKTDISFLKKVFTARERTYCFSYKDPAPHLAARFCAKEAVIKALAVMGIAHLSFNHIEILENRGKPPSVHIIGASAKDCVIQVTLSHTHTTALAFVIAYRTAPVAARI